MSNLPLGATRPEDQKRFHDGAVDAAHVVKSDMLAEYTDAAGRAHACTSTTSPPTHSHTASHTRVCACVRVRVHTVDDSANHVTYRRFLRRLQSCCR